MTRVIVIGGGAAGMMAAVSAADSGAEVILLEKNEKLGKKIYITGKGRCNVTNAADMETLFANVCTNQKFLYSAFYGFDNMAVMRFFEEEGCALKVERGDRVFPVTDHSSDVIFALQRAMKRKGVQILLHTEAKRLLTKDENGTPVICGVQLSSGKEMVADKVIVCTGGLSYPSTGSTGDGYRFAEETGHQVTKLFPSLVSLRVQEDWVPGLSGLSLKNVAVSMVQKNRVVFDGFGEMLFTHFGVSGPLILSASSRYMQGVEAHLYIDLKPAMDEEQLDKRLLRDFEENKNKQFKNALGGLFPIKLIPVMISLSGIHPDKKVHEITREERKQFVNLIKKLPLSVTGTGGFAEAVITRGGVSVKDINPSTMESKKIKGLYFAGEVIDVDAYTGGFNLQIAWSTGYLAGLES